MMFLQGTLQTVENSQARDYSAFQGSQSSLGVGDHPLRLSKNKVLHSIDDKFITILGTSLSFHIFVTQ